MDDALSSANAERGPWSTGLATVVALLPLTIALAAVVAADRKVLIGPAGPNQLVYWVGCRSERCIRPLRPLPDGWRMHR
jgi:hypothetical protein